MCSQPFVVETSPFPLPLPLSPYSLFIAVILSLHVPTYNSLFPVPHLFTALVIVCILLLKKLVYQTFEDVTCIKYGATNCGAPPEMHLTLGAFTRNIIRHTHISFKIKGTVGRFIYSNHEAAVLMISIQNNATQTEAG